MTVKEFLIQTKSKRIYYSQTPVERTTKGCSSEIGTNPDGSSRKPEVMVRKRTSSDCNNNKDGRLKIRQN